MKVDEHWSVTWNTSNRVLPKNGTITSKSMTALTAWQNFYEIVGSSAGALIGLQFVVTALVAQLPSTWVGDGADAEAFSTPTIVHFGAVLLVAGIISAPWHDLNPVALILGLAGVAGLIYATSITLRMRRQTAYRPAFEDWLCHCMLPLAAYAVLIASATLLLASHEALFGVAGAVLMLLFIGIHNAWDAAAYHVFERSRRRAAHAKATAEETTHHGD